MAHHYMCSRPATTRLARTLGGASSSTCFNMCAKPPLRCGRMELSRHSPKNRLGTPGIRTCSGRWAERSGPAMLCCRLKVWRTGPTQDGNGTDTTSVLCRPMLAEHCFADLNEARKHETRGRSLPWLKSFSQGGVRAWCYN